MRTERFRDKATWPAGPWTDEPDKAQWVDEATSLDCLIVRNDSGALCGYVGVTAGHPWYGVGYDDLVGDANVHGGLTFASPCDEGGHICHVPEPGRSGDVWWLGFDCAHLMDKVPAHMKYGFSDKEYRDFEYVKNECAKLAAQALEVANGR